MLMTAICDIARIKNLIHFYCSPFYVSLQAVRDLEHTPEVLARARSVLLRCRFYEDLTAGLIDYFQDRGQYRVVNTHQSTLEVTAYLRRIFSM